MHGCACGANVWRRSPRTCPADARSAIQAAGLVDVLRHIAGAGATAAAGARAAVASWSVV